MYSQSKALKRLVWLYGQLVLRMQAQSAVQKAMMRAYGETLPSRLLMSVSSTGSETLVNTTTGNMSQPAVAMNPAGNSVVVWATSSSGGQVLGQRYNINGSRVGSQFLVDQNPTGSVAAPNVAIDDVGDFVVVWAKGASVYARVFGSAGIAVTGDTLVTSGGVGNSNPVVAMNAAGGFTIAWQGSGSADSNGIYKRQFLVSGVATGNAIVVDAATPGTQTNPAIAMDPAGDAVIAWTDTSTSDSTIQAVHFAASGSVTAQFAAGAQTGDDEDLASVGISALGSFVIAWQTDYSGMSGNDGITARVFSAAATPLTNVFMVNSYAIGAQTSPTVAERNDGSFVIAFESENQDLSGEGVFAQVFNASGATDGNETQVNTTTISNQQDPAAAWTGGNDVIVWDGNGAGSTSGVFLQRYSTGGTANQTPVVSVPLSQTIYKNNSLNFTMSVSDADAQGGVEQITLTATNGVLALSTTSSLIFSSGSSSSATMTFSGTLASINAALNAITFTPTLNYVGPAPVQLVINDLGNTGIGGPEGTAGSFTINVNSPPTSDTVPGAQTTFENVPLIFKAANDNSLYAGSASGAIELSISSGTLTLSTTSGISFINGSVNQSANVEISGTVANINAALNGLTYAPATNFTGPDPLAFTTASNSANLATSMSTYAIPLTVFAPPPPVNQAPTITTPGTQATAENSALTLRVGNTLSIADTDANGNAEQLMLTATNGTLTVASTAGLTFSTGTGADDASMTITGTLANINAALNGLTFSPAPGIYGSGAIYAALNDLGNTGTGGAQTAVATLAINITQVNQFPAIAVPPDQTIAENTEFDFSSVNSNAISLSDVDDNGAAEQLTLNCTHGTLQFGSSSGLTFDSGANGQWSITISGTLTALNTALNTLTFFPTTTFVGNASLQFLLNDLGNTGSGGAKTASGAVNINVARVAHTPTVTNAVSNLGQMTTNGLVIVKNAPDFGQTIDFQITDIIGGSLFQNDGTTAIANGDFITSAQGQAGLKFLPDPLSLSPGGFNVQSSLTASVGGLGGTVVAATIDVSPASAPVNSVPAAQITAENTPLVFSSAAGSAITISNLDGGIQEVVLTAGNGTLSLGSSNSNANLILFGAPAQLTAELNGLTFTPTANFSGVAIVQLTSADARSIALGNVLAATTSIPITVSATTTPTAPPTVMPALLTDGGLVAQTGALATITSTALNAAETGLTPDQLIFTVTQPPKFGQLLLDGQPLSTGGTFTQADIDGSKIAYSSASRTPVDDGFKFFVTDTSGTAISPAIFSIHAVAPPIVPVKPSLDINVPALPQAPASLIVASGRSTDLISDIENVPTVATSIFAASDSEAAVVLADLVATTGDSPVAAPVFASPKVEAVPARPSAPPRNAAVPTAPPEVDSKPPKIAAGSNANSSQNTIITLKGNQKLWQDLDIMQQQVDVQHEAHVRIVAGSATLVSAGMSVMYFVWAIRAGSILSSLLSSMPAWNLVDPLPILNQAAGEGDLGEPDSEEDEETLESMVDQPKRRAA